MGKLIRSLGYLLVVLTICFVGVTPVMAQAEPDLQPTQIIVANIYAGATNTVTVVIANNNDVAVNDFDVRLEADGVEVGTVTGNSILASGDPSYWPVSVNFEWVPATAGDYTLTAVVDSAGAVAESDETNNELQRVVTVIPAEPVTVTVRVEGQTSTIWSGEVTFFTSLITDKYGDTYDIDHPTAMGALHAASIAGGFNIVIDSMFGPVDYVEEVAGEAYVMEPPWPGWLFRVNWVDAGISAIDYGIADGDEVLWYYGIYGTQPLRMTVSSDSVLLGDTFTVTVEAYDGASWNAVAAGVPVYAGTLTYATDANGQVLDLALNAGAYPVYADTGDYTEYTRSNTETVIVYVPLSLQPGWNFISVPKKLASGYSTAEQVFANVDTGGHSIFLYHASNGWVPMEADTEVSPLDGIWIYSTTAVELHPAFDTNPRQVPPTKQLEASWNAIGFSDFTAASANSALTSVEAQWAVLLGFDAATQTYEVSIINNAPAGDPHSEVREMFCWKGYWLYLISAGELAGIGS
jgi:hypothetical protein